MERSPALRWPVIVRALAAALLVSLLGAGVMVYPDHSDPNGFYYLPQR
jgi:hypothetical protein